jgi:DNA-binding NarL/FixJ family response regulator
LASHYEMSDTMHLSKGPIGMTHNSNVSVLVVDDFKEWRDQVRKLLQPRPELKVVGEACNGDEAVAKAIELQPDIILLDLALPTIPGIEAARIIRQRCPRSKILFVSQNTDKEIIEAAMATGDGYVFKTKAAHDLLPAIATALDR